MKFNVLFRIEVVKFFTRINVLFLLLLPLVVVVLTKVQVITSEAESPEVLQQGDVSILNESYLKVISVIGVFYIAFSIIVSVGREFSSGTFRKNLVDGLSRLDFFLSKLGSIIIHILSVSIIALMSYAVLALTSDFGSFVLKDSILPQIGSFIIVFFTYGLIGLFFAILFKDPVRAAAAFFLYRLFEKILLSLDEKQWKIGFANYLPINTIDKAVDLISLSLPVVTLLVLYLFFVAFLSYFFLSRLDA